MDQFLQYHRRMLIVMAGVCAGVFLALAAGNAAWAVGFGAGAAAQLAKFGLIDVAVVRRLAAENAGATAAQLKAMLLSLALFGIAAVAAHRFGGNVWALAAGIFLPRTVLVADAWIRPNPFGSE